MLKTWLRAMRVNQWPKNAFVLMAWFFAFGDPSQADIARGARGTLLALGMTAAFCLVSSAFYLLNDVSDCEADRRHPRKRFRPVAAGLVSQVAAVRAALVLLAAGLSFPAAVAFRADRLAAFGTILAYAVLQCLYSGFLKRLPYVDVLVIAVGFVLRAVAGAAIINARVSPWLLACTFALSLFLALAKRRHEKTLSGKDGAGGGTFRAALAGYHLRVIDVLIALSAVGAAGVYVCYTCRSEMALRFPKLIYTGAFVVAGIARYLWLVYRNVDVGAPEKVLYSDKVFWAILAGYAASAVYAVVLPQLVSVQTV